MKLYPAIDLLGGRCVRLAQGRFDQVTVYGDDPVATAAGFQAAGAAMLHLVDLDGSRDGAAHQAALIGQVVQSTGLKVQVGGGIRSVASAEAYLRAGVDRVVVGSLAVRAPEMFAAMARALGPERLTLALDVRRGSVDVDFEVAVQGWTETSGVGPWVVLERALRLGVTRVLCTDISRDGLLSGPNLALYGELRQRFPTVELLASGGVAGVDDFARLSEVGAYGVIVGKALYAGRFTFAEALACCENA